MSDLRAILVVKLRRAADAKGLDDRALAIRSGVQQRRIARLWKGQRFSLETIEALARALRLRWADLALIDDEGVSGSEADDPISVETDPGNNESGHAAPVVRKSGRNT